MMLRTTTNITDLDLTTISDATRIMQNEQLCWNLLLEGYLNNTGSITDGGSSETGELNIEDSAKCRKSTSNCLVRGLERAMVEVNQMSSETQPGRTPETQK